MILTKIKRSCHGRSAWAEYEMKGFRMDVYLRHTIPCSRYYGELNISCYLKPKNNDLVLRERKEFSNYLEFINYRNQLTNELI